MIGKSKYDEYLGRDVYLYTLCGDGLTVGVTDFGGVIQFIELDTPSGRKNVALGFDGIKNYIDSKTYAGAVVGRVANRIANGKFSIDGKEYELDRNDGKNCNHSGFDGYDKRFFEAETDGDTLRLTLDSADGDQGFPGRLKLTVEYTVSGKQLDVKFSVVSDKDTLFAPTSHTYFNLGGEEDGSAGDTLLYINANSYTPKKSDNVPTGEIVSVDGTPFDFRSAKRIDEDIAKVDGGYDHNFVVDGELNAKATCERSGVSMEVYSDFPGIQLYTGGGLDGKQGRSRKYYPLDAFCLEPQYFPNAINTRTFKSPILKAGEKRKHYIRYVFNV